MTGHKAQQAVETYDENGLRLNRTKRGTGTKYNDTFPDQLREYVKEHKEGMSRAEVGRLFHASPRAVTNWINRYPEFKQALIECRLIVDQEVVKSLYDRAVGYTYTETKVVKDGEGNILKEETVTKLMAPDVAAQQFWLTNRQKDQWKNTKSQMISGPNDGPIKLKNADGLSDEQLFAIITGQQSGSSE